MHKPILKTAAFCVALAIAGLSPASSSAQNAGQFGGPDYEECVNFATLFLIDCVGKKAIEWDRKLNVAYQEAMNFQNSASARNRLRSAQRLWIRYRDSNCRFYYSEPGSIANIAAAECFRFMTESRARELQDYLRR